MKLKRRLWFVVGLIGILLIIQNVVMAHANLIKAEPAANSVLEEAPAEIRMWFTEPLESRFSKINLRNSEGNIVNTPPTQIDPNDPTQMSIIPGALPDGLYTVVWRALSSADGHPTIGSYAIVIGDATLLQSSAANTAEDPIRTDSTVIRWINLLSMALTVGGIAFFLFVWLPAAPETQPNKAIERPILLLTAAGWVLVGVTGFLLLALQYSLATGNPILTGIDGNSLNSIIADTRFGHLWLSRTALWAGLGGALWFARSDRFFYWVALVMGAVILAINSAFSHANAAYDLTVSVGADFLHLFATAVWVGGLVHFLNVIAPIRRTFPSSTLVLGRVVGRFSNFARVSVATLFITGFYSAWLQVGTVEGLLTTQYGIAMLIKLILFVPVLGLAVVNLIYTHRGLEAEQDIWATRLRGLVGAEIVLTVGILLAVGVMTSISPARTTMAYRAANPPPPEALPLKDVRTVNGLLVEFDATPGWLGENTFTIKVVDSNGAPINDITLIRMRFESQTQNLGESELRPERVAEGVYRISGANLSVPGPWRVRVTIQRPNQFDTLVDFTPDVPTAPPTTAPVPLPEPNTPLPNRVFILLVAGVMALGVGGFFLGENRAKLVQASSLLAVGLLIMGGAFLFSAIQGAPTLSSVENTGQLSEVDATNVMPGSP
ncbi:MAG: copper resistance protein CopC [Chloroflexi bacterium]|nr:copper resistance protein CopC [Chloroflexota bacterium]MCC6893105.1 copper resistance protein CopC [Anaerolineae bacterium]